MQNLDCSTVRGIAEYDLLQSALVIIHLRRRVLFWLLTLTHSRMCIHVRRSGIIERYWIRLAPCMPTASLAKYLFALIHSWRPGSQADLDSCYGLRRSIATVSNVVIFNSPWSFDYVLCCNVEWRCRLPVHLRKTRNVQTFRENHDPD